MEKKNTMSGELGIRKKKKKKKICINQCKVRYNKISHHNITHFYVYRNLAKALRAAIASAIVVGFIGAATLTVVEVGVVNIDDEELVDDNEDDKPVDDEEGDEEKVLFVPIVLLSTFG